MLGRNFVAQFAFNLMTTTTTTGDVEMTQEDKTRDKQTNKQANKQTVGGLRLFK